MASLVFLSPLLAGAPRATASTLPAEDSPTEDTEQIELLDQRFELVRHPSQLAGQGLVFSPEGKRVYYLQGAAPRYSNGYPHLTAATVDGAVVAQAKLDPPALAGPLGGNGSIAVGPQHGMLVDDVAAEIYVAHQPYARRDDRVATATASAGAVSNGGACAGLGVEDFDLTSTCLAGVHVLDAATLAPRRKLRFNPITLDGILLSPHLRAMELVRTAEGTPKLHLLVEEFALEANGVSEGQQLRGVYQTTTAYAVQIDATSGAQDWIVRIEACRGIREARAEKYEGGAYNALLGRPNPAAILWTPEAVYAACHSGTSQIGTVVRIPLDATLVPVGVASGDEIVGVASGRDIATPDAVFRVREQQLAFFGPDKVFEIIADPVSGRVLMRVLDGGADVWWVFDTSTFRMLGTIGIGKATISSTLAGLDRHAGRLYVLAAPHKEFVGGLLVADIRGLPIAQALHFPRFVSAFPSTGTDNLQGLWVMPDKAGARIFIPEDRRSAWSYQVLWDATSARPNLTTSGWDGRTLDLDEADGNTSASFDGAARGYGARALFVGGGEAVLRMGPADPVGAFDNAQTGDSGRGYRDTTEIAPSQELVPPLITANPVTGPHVNTLRGMGVPTRTPAMAGPRPLLLDGLGYPFGSPCLYGNREVVLGMVGPDGPSVLDMAGARAGAEPIIIDSFTRADAESPASRCSARDWQALWQAGLFGKPPTEEPAAQTGAEGRGVECVSGEQPSASVGDAIANFFAAKVQCEGDEASGFSYTRGLALGGVAVGEALSSFRIYRDPGRGIVARIESVARGVQIEGLVRIDTVRGTAESWANGRMFSVSDGAPDDGYDPNCDLERTAGTCFRRHLFGVWTPGWSCGPCGDESALVQRLSRALGANAQVRLREPDGALARGADNGFIAAITKPESERFADLVLNNDLLQTVLPTLEIVRYAPANRPLPPGGGSRGRQIYQFAGVEVSSSYGIQCLLVYDEEANTCAAEAEEPGSLTVKLTDGDDKPLAGGAFEVRKDVDADGVVGLVDTLLADGACVTAADGIGTCTFDDLQPGSYLVTQTAAPPGYAKVDDTWVSEVSSGEARTVAFSNTSNVSTIDVSAVDEDGKPISGAVFAVYPDPDADGKVAADAQPSATCTTNDQGTCSMSVPVGSYVLVQQSAPAGLEGIEPVAFAFASGGQTAAVGVTNYGAGVPDLAPAAGPVYTDPVNYSPPVETVDDYTPPIVDEPRISVPEQVGSTVVKVIQAPGDVLRLLSRDPQQAAAWLASLILFALAAAAIRRRQQALDLM